MRNAIKRQKKKKTNQKTKKQTQYRNQKSFTPVFKMHLNQKEKPKIPREKFYFVFKLGFIQFIYKYRNLAKRLDAHELFYKQFF